MLRGVTPLRQALLISSPLEESDAVLLQAVRQRDGEEHTLETAAHHHGFGLAELFATGDGAPSRSGIFVARLGRLVYRLFVPLDSDAAPRDTIAKSLFVWDLASAPFGAPYTSYLAVRRGEDAPVLVPFPEVPEALRSRPDTVETTRASLHELVRAVTDSANVALLAGRMLHPGAHE